MARALILLLCIFCINASAARAADGEVSGTQCWVNGTLVGGFPPGYACPTITGPPPVVIQRYPSAAGSEMPALAPVQQGLANELNAIADTPLTLMQKGEFAMKNGDLVRAKQYFDEADRRDPHNPQILKDIAVLKYAQEQILELSVEDKIAEQCSALDEVMAESRNVHLKVAMLNAEALGRVLRVPVAFVEEPPEYVLDEAKNILKQIASITEKIDELSGKKAWTERQEKWVRDHIFVASSTGNYAIDRSNTTIHGQMDFSSLEKMPAFAGCSRDSEGYLYIPQLTSWPRSWPK